MKIQRTRFSSLLVILLLCLAGLLPATASAGTVVYRHGRYYYHGHSYRYHHHHYYYNHRAWVVRPGYPGYYRYW